MVLMRRFVRVRCSIVELFPNSRARGDLGLRPRRSSETASFRTSRLFSKPAGRPSHAMIGRLKLLLRVAAGPKSRTPPSRCRQCCKRRKQKYAARLPVIHHHAVDGRRDHGADVVSGRNKAEDATVRPARRHGAHQHVARGTGYAAEQAGSDVIATSAGRKTRPGHEARTQPANPDRRQPPWHDGRFGTPARRRPVRRARSSA